MSKTKNQDVASEEGTDSNEGQSLIVLKVLPLIKERQQQHGLRHGDYQRYHGYCSRRLRRLRETLKMPQGDRRHFKKKDVTLSDIDSKKGDSRYLEVPLTLTERAWACAMELKQDANTETRKRFHMIARFRKAVGLAENFLTLSQESERIDARTKLECEAYASFIFASFYFEMQLWEEAMSAFKKSQSIYSQIGQALGDHPEASVYTEKTTELLPTMRFCAYQTGEELQISDLSAEFQSAAIAKMIAQKPKMSEVIFRKHKITVPSEKIAGLLVRIDEFQKKTDQKIDMYEQILVDLRDVIQAVRDMQKPEQQGAKAKPSMLLSYLLYLRLTLTNSRTELMMEDKSQPKDSIRLTEMILHNFAEMKTIAVLDSDDDFQSEVDDYIFAFKGVRCRFLADVFKSNKKWSEAYVLYEQSEEYFNKALKGLPSDSSAINTIANTRKYIKGAFLECHAHAVLENVQEDTDSSIKLTRPKTLLEDRLDDYVLDETLSSGEPQVATFPEEWTHIECKPLFFDLALNNIKPDIPEVEEKAGLVKKSPKKDGTQSAGLTGFVKGLWGWGK